jgi:membrane protease YdiL (CAAX protease family)
VDLAQLRRHRLELGVFLLLFLPPIVLGQILGGSKQSFVVTTVATVLNDVALVALALFFLWSDGEPLASIGWTRRRAGREIGIGVLLYIPMLLALGVLAWLLHALGLHGAGTPPAFLQPRGAGELVLATVLALVVACAEETIFRGYLLLRLRELVSTPAAVAISTAVFAAGHTYEGVTGVIAVAALGTIFSLVLLWRKSLVAPIAMHFIQDFLGLVIAPLLK